ncbi:MAG: FAD-dependent oxidoreductase [Proteobacteria bacterium]|nr:FAD-dependent oxidoreductase [Pseudomonadota bacterium]NIS67883.1 FAD-dependent oxidoreductase [Pseudomonadota bacterium]
MHSNYDVLIVGGGIIGSSIAYNLMNDEFSGTVAVFEKDPTYEFSSTTLSAGGIRRQFSTEVNIRISQYGVQFYEQFDEAMSVDGERAHGEFHQRGYLFLANEKNWPLMEQHHEFQTSLGVKVDLLSSEETLKIIPHLNTEDLVGASFSAGDGYLDPYGTLQGYAKKARCLGVTYVTDEVTKILRDKNRITGLVTDKGDTYNSSIVVNCAGPWAADVGRMAGVDLPVDPVRRMAYVFQPAEIFDYDLPLVIDVTGLYFRHETGRIIMTGKSISEEPSGINFAVDKAFFHDTMWPILANRIPVFDRLKLIRGWAGLYAINRLDSNALIGEHPDLEGFYMAIGFSGHGFQQAPAVGKGMSELIRLGHYEALDLSPLSYERVLTGKLVVEEEVV